MVGAKSLGDEARQAQWAPKGHGRRRGQARGHSAPGVGRGDRVQLVEEGGCRVTSDNEIKGFPQHGGKRRPCRDDGGGEIARFFASFQSERLRDCSQSVKSVIWICVESIPTRSVKSVKSVVRGRVFL